jgi:cytochrome P450
LRPTATEFAEGLAGDMVKRGAPADLVSEFATPLPVRVLCQLLGVPTTDQNKFHEWSEVFVSATSLPLATILEYLGNLNNYMADLVNQRRREPRDDLISALVKARDENNDRLTENEMVELAAGLLAAGHDTMVNQIPNCVYVLLANRDRWEELRADPSLIPAAVEELMRFIPLGVAAAFARYATEDIEVGGVLVKAGEPVLASTASANRDERAFPEPHRIDFRRQASPPHLGFGHGVHHCVGAALARMELQVALRTLLSRFPQLAFAVPESGLEWKKGLLVRGLKELPVTW